MWSRMMAGVGVWCSLFALAWAGGLGDVKAEVGDVLTLFHSAASRADGAAYFALFAEDAVFIGTDVGERWSVEQFKAFAEPYFSEGRGWTYEKRERNIVVSDSGNVAWFDEILWNESYGICRGTGVLVATGKGWRITQYHLTIPIPNDLAREFTGRIKEFEGATSE